MKKVRTILTPADIARLPADPLLASSVCVVFDVLRATSTIATALANGASEILPVSTIEEALSARAPDPAILLAGERHGDPIAGFDFGNSPLEFTPERVTGKRIVTTTTNGTVALRACAGAAQVIAGSLLNLSAVAAHVRESDFQSVILVCAGTFDTFALEDAYAAGLLAAKLGGGDADDATVACLSLHEVYGGRAETALLLSRNGQALLRAGRRNDLEWCAVVDRYAIVPSLTGNALHISRSAEIGRISP